LVVEDDQDLIEMLRFALTRVGYEVAQTSNPTEAMRLLRETEPDLAVLDVNLGPWSGFDLLQDLRRVSQIPVIMLTGRHAEEDKVRGLELGADDYVTKPFSYRELIARIQANIRRHEGAAGNQELAPKTQPATHVGPLTLNSAEHTVSKDGKALKLTPIEFRVLECLMQRAGTVVPTRALLKEIWGFDDPSGADLVRVTVYRLRRKLEDDPSAPALIQTVAGVGVILKTE
jgi:DNA-binding response OmpR family regulator